MKIQCITECLELLPTLVEWERAEWGDDWAKVVEQATASNTVPTIFVALDGDQPMGCAMLIEYDMTTRLDLTPWLGGIFVHPAYRKRGVASALVRHAMDKAEQTGIPTWWLYTASSRQLYERFDWKYVETVQYEGESVTLMRYDFESSKQ
jgi:GNAT superfamily N-acetyltransferase